MLSTVSKAFCSCNKRIHKVFIMNKIMKYKVASTISKVFHGCSKSIHKVFFMKILIKNEMIPTK